MQYQLESLKTACGQFLSSKLTIESVVEVVILADMHGAALLRTNCIDYITKHAKEVKQTDQWKQLENHSKLLMDIVQNIISNLDLSK